MYSATRLQVDKLENGFGIKAAVLEDGNVKEKKFVFTSFRDLTHSIAAAFGIDGLRDACRPEMTPDEMRDELGELRRFKDRAIKRDEEVRASLERAVAVQADLKAQRDRYLGDAMRMEEERDAALTKLAKREKRRHK